MILVSGGFLISYGTLIRIKNIMWYSWNNIILTCVHKMFGGLNALLGSLINQIQEKETESDSNTCNQWEKLQNLMAKARKIWALERKFNRGERAYYYARKGCFKMKSHKYTYLFWFIMLPSKNIFMS